MGDIDIEKYKQCWDYFDVDLYVKYLVAKALKKEKDNDKEDND